MMYRIGLDWIDLLRLRCLLRKFTVQSQCMLSWKSCIQLTRVFPRKDRCDQCVFLEVKREGSGVVERCADVVERAGSDTVPGVRVAGEDAGGVVSCRIGGVHISTEQVEQRKASLLSPECVRSQLREGGGVGLVKCPRRVGLRCIEVSIKAMGGAASVWKVVTCFPA